MTMIYMWIQLNTLEKTKAKLHLLSMKPNSQINMILRLHVSELLHRKPLIAQTPNQTIIFQEQLPKVHSFTTTHFLVNFIINNRTRTGTGEPLVPNKVMLFR